MMKASEFVKEAIQIADCTSTIYMQGGHGHSLTWNDTFNELIRDYSYNKKHETELRQQFEQKKADHPFAFDCCGLIKGIVWGFNGDYKVYGGGTTYQSNGCLDEDAEGLFYNYGYNADSKMDTLVPGEMLYMKGHCGIYIGNGEVVESTPKWKGCAQRTKVSDRKWLKHCYLGFIDYTEDTPQENPFVVKCPHCGKDIILSVDIQTVK